MRVSNTLCLLAATVASAQSSQSRHNYTTELDMKIDPNSVSAQQRAVWCQAQTNTCGLLCDNNTGKNACSQEDLGFDCTCASNNSSPGLQFYTQTMPTFICETLFSQCNMENVGSADGQKACTTNIRDLCGTNPPPKAPISSDDHGDGNDDSKASSSSGPTASQTGGSAVVSTTSGGFAAPTMAPGADGVVAAAALGFLALLI
ncbi:hypothetical protein CDD81_5458 [Ophiocordyceps australis]|uniref:DUF7707 domain-containing protein n=1 Tax=Ophiocordyceps australis TaxID=1399860 RepID=A0A2C5YA99_9HYPO|nr:hypothetical protein CDD81_5458 [Ophiocordyceps australis]